MIDFEDAQNLLSEHALKLAVEQKSTYEALGMTLASDIFAPLDLPPFDCSSVDGFALKISDRKNYHLRGSIRAVSQDPFQITTEAVRIMTGAPVPQGADAVIMKEEVELLKDEIVFRRTPEKNENIRFKGEDIKIGTLALKKGDVIKPKTLGLMLALGLDKIDVFTPPKIRIIATGDELVDPPKILKHGEVYHLMGPMLKAQTLGFGLLDVQYERVGDDEQAILNALKKALDKADIILLSGGISKGEFDLVKPALNRLDVKEVFHGGSWRPGKPLYFGLKNSTRIFGLPGNPVSAFSCTRIFVKTLIDASFNHINEAKQAILLNDFKKKPGVTQFLQARVQDGLFVMDKQGSHHIFALSKANALCLAPKECAIVKAGELVKYYPI